MGPKWTLRALAYVEDDPSNPAQTARIYLRGGGVETYTNYDPATRSYAVEWRSRALLVRVSSSPIRYERRLPDGGVEVYSQPDGGISFPRKVFLTEEKDPQGNTLSFVYDEQLRLAAIADAIGQVTTLSYGNTDPLKVTAITDPFGRSATLAYDGNGRLSTITDVIGLTSSFTYGASDFMTSLTTPYGTTRFTTGQAGGRTWLESEDPLGGQERVEYVQPHDPAVGPRFLPASELPAGFTQYNGNFDAGLTYFWDKRAMALGKGDPSKAEVMHWLEHPTQHRSQGVIRALKKPLESRIFYAFAGHDSSHGRTDSRPIRIGRLLDDPDGQGPQAPPSQIYQYEYGPRGSVTKYIDPLSRETIYEYDPANDIDLSRVKQKNPASASGYDLLWSATYGTQHHPLTFTDAPGQTWVYTYNAQGQLATVTTPPRAGISENRTTTYNYDTNGYLQSITGLSPGAKSTFAYDGHGRLHTTTDSDNYILTYAYDALDRPTRVTYPDSTYEEIVYNRLNAESSRDRLGRWTQVFSDALGRAVAIRDPLGQTTTQQWCSCGSLDKVIDPNGNARSWERDIQGRLTREIRADSSAIEVIYENTTSRVRQLRDPKSQARGYEYFLDNSLKQITYTNAEYPTPSVSMTYETSYARPQSMTDGTGTTRFEHHPTATPPQLGAGRLASVDGPLAGDTDKITLGYDELGRVVRREINGVANLTTQVFDALHRLASETNPIGTFSYGYDGVTARPKTISYPVLNGQTTTFDYLDNRGDHRLKEIHHQRTGGATVSKFSYTTSAMGLVTTWTQKVDSAAPTTHEFGYDPVNQLMAATLKGTGAPPAILKSYGYTYDKAGNRTTEAIDNRVTGVAYNNVNRALSQQIGGALRFTGGVSEPAAVTVADQPARVDPGNRFEGAVNTSSGTNTVAVTATDASGNVRTNTYEVSIDGSTGGFAHDANGNLRSDGARTYQWDAEDRLLAVVHGRRRSEFTYNGAGQRVRIIEKDNGVVLADRRYLWCGLAICEERDAAGATVTRRFFPQGMQEGAIAYFYTRDHLASIREMTDSAGVVRARYGYDPYGRQTKVSGDKDAPFGFTGHFVHSPSGLLLAPARVYSTSLGRWISEDPIGLAGGENLYAYVSNGPTNAIDPTGQIAIADDALILLFVGGIILTGMVITQMTKNPPQLPPLPPPADPADPSNSPQPTPAPPPGQPPGPPAPPAAPPHAPPLPPPAIPVPPAPGHPQVQVPSGPKRIPPPYTRSCRVIVATWIGYCGTKCGLAKAACLAMVPWIWVGCLAGGGSV